MKECITIWCFEAVRYSDDESTLIHVEVNGLANALCAIESYFDDYYGFKLKGYDDGSGYVALKPISLI